MQRVQRVQRDNAAAAGEDLPDTGPGPRFPSGARWRSSTPQVLGEPAEFNATRRVARCLAVTGPSALAGLTKAALSAHPLLQRPRFDACVAVELVTEARHRITNPHMFSAPGNRPRPSPPTPLCSLKRRHLV
ncbi:hypothetical protein ACIPWY_40135 [Streptomyces sp. NPDC090032]|uniref:hypothetical protein n=1 Tax=Streptomyces sp. NPDC090032 TaxID=3365925 RepID=UPI00380927B3